MDKVDKKFYIFERENYREKFDLKILGNDIKVGVANINAMNRGDMENVILHSKTKNTMVFDNFEKGSEFLRKEILDGIDKTLPNFIIFAINPKSDNHLKVKLGIMSRYKCEIII